MNLLGIVITVLFLFLFLLFAVGSVLLGLERSRYRQDKFAKRTEEKPVDAFLQKEEGLASVDAADLVRSSPRAEEHGKRAAELAEGARKRVRNRARQVVSGESGHADPAGS